MVRPSTPSPLAPPPDPPPRFTVRPLPAYRHLPGLTPHPVNHPAGHSHGREEALPELPPEGLPAGWRRCEPYLFGIDLFNRAYFWEAHEEWEGLWHAVGHDTVPGRFLQGLIQVAAAELQRHRGHRRGVAYLLEKAWANLRPAREAAAAGGPPAAPARYMGIDLEACAETARRHLAGESERFPFLTPAPAAPLRR